ncbi:type VI secretion protein [Streptomyces sp. NPDC004111]|uniref:type IV secretory system conjugative DNA transfer family protein n=1 Tax=Streptomyces sp. NPDC004111 TaxID=3364690 RepID=UPI0036CCF75F
MPPTPRPPRPPLLPTWPTPAAVPLGGGAAAASLGGGAAPRGRNGRARGRPPAEPNTRSAHAPHTPALAPALRNTPGQGSGHGPTHNRHTHPHTPHTPRPERGIPDSLLVGLLALLLGLTVLTWTATGLAGLFAHGSWPKDVTFPNTPTALRQLATAPTDLAAAWPSTPPAELSGYGLFWGLFIGQFLVLIVLTIFVLGTLARWRLVRAQAREDRLRTPHETSVPPSRTPSDEAPAQATESLTPPSPEPSRTPEPNPAPGPSPTPVPPAMPEAEPQPQPATTSHPSTASHPGPGPAPQPRTDPEFPATPLYNRTTHRRTALQTVLEAPGAALVLTSDPTLWSETTGARSKLGPVLLYDPNHLCDTPDRLHWSPFAGCERPLTAAARATALLAPVRPQARMDAAIADTAETLLRSYLHAAAISGSNPLKQLHRWTQGSHTQEAVRILRTHPKATSGAAGLLESALTAYPERREIAQELTARAFSALSSIHIRESCTPNRNDSLTLESFADEGGTLYVVGEPIEDPRTRPSGPGAMPLLTALASYVVEHGRRMAARSSDGRLDPPMTLVLDDVAAVAPLPQLPELLTAGQGQGLPTLALLRSEEQFKSRWPQRS